MKVYIAGAITNNPNYMEHFKAAEERLKAAGHAVVNPCKNDGFTYREYINMGLCELMHCDAIYLLKGYEESTGATLEHDYARSVGLKIYVETDLADEITIEDVYESWQGIQGIGDSVDQRCKDIVTGAIGKQVALVPIKKKSRFADYICPICESAIFEKNTYCYRCGQKLEWEV